MSQGNGAEGVSEVMEFFSHADAFAASFLLEANDFPFPVEQLSGLNRSFNVFFDLRAHYGRFRALVAWQSSESTQPVETVEELVVSFPNEEFAIAFLSEEQERLLKIGTPIDDLGPLGEQSIVVGFEEISEYSPSTYTIYCSIRKSIAVIRLTAVINTEDLAEIPFDAIANLLKKAVQKLDNGILLKV